MVMRVFRTLCLGLAVTLVSAAMPAAAQQPTAVFTLADALRRAMDESPEGAAALARVEAAGRALEYAGHLPNPIFELRSENWGARAPSPGLPLDIYATVTQTVEFGGKRDARRGVARADSQAALAAASVVRHDVALDVSRLYMEALRAREHQRALAAQSRDMAELVRILTSRVAVGSTAESDLLKMRTEEARAAADVVRTRLAASRALAQLTARLGVDTSLEALMLPAAPPPTAGDHLSAVARRADVSAAARAVDAARQSARLENARGIPDANVHAGMKRTTGFNTGVVAVTVPIPLFDRNRTARILAQGRALAAEREQKAVERRALGEIRATRNAAAALIEHAANARTALVEPARGAREAARAAFQSGALDVLRLLDAERVFTGASIVAIDLEIDAVVTAIEARLAAGEDPLP
ncbi:MAG: TolC family protein [Acidobacteria bacterium]|nr:TolC family protein [Acidobacteriota bacterium]